MSVSKPWQMGFDCDITEAEVLYAGLSGRPIDENVGELIRRATACQRKFSGMDTALRSWSYFESMRRLANAAVNYGHMAAIRMDA